MALRLWRMAMPPTAPGGERSCVPANSTDSRPVAAGQSAALERLPARRPPVAWAEGAVLLLALALLLPFVSKALTIDDPLFMWLARQIQRHPLDAYGFSGNWLGYEQPMHLSVLNPPLTSYWLALAGTVSWSEWWLHVAMLPWPLLVLGGTMRLARRLGANPALAGLLTLATAAFLVSATNVMCDVMLTALMVWSVTLWVEGLERRSLRRLLVSGLLAGLAILTKYFGLALVPLLLVYTVIRQRRLTGSLLPLLIPVAIVAGWNIWTQRLYGIPHMVACAEFAPSRTFTAWFPLNRLYPTATFLGGCLIWPLVVALWRGGWLARAAMAAGLAVGPLGLRFWLTHKQGGAAGAAWEAYVLAAVFFAAGIALVYLAWRFLWANRHDSTAWLLGLWVGGTVLFVFCVNWTVSGRNILPLVPALALMAARPLAARQGAAAGPAVVLPRCVAAVAVALGLAAALAATWADFNWANSVRLEAARLADKYAARGRAFCASNSGFQYYLEARGVPAFDWHKTTPAADDLFIASVTFLQQEAPRDFLRWPCLETGAAANPARLYLMNPASGAGFYTHGFGPLPMSVGLRDADRYVVLKPRPAGGSAD